MTAVSPAAVTRDDIEAKLRQLRGEVDNARTSARNTALIAGAAAAVVVVGVVFLLGKRRGRKKSTVVEIRRV